MMLSTFHFVVLILLFAVVSQNHGVLGRQQEEWTTDRIFHRRPPFDGIISKRDDGWGSIMNTAKDVSIFFAIQTIRGGGGGEGRSSTNHVKPKVESHKFDEYARSMSLLLIWVVAYQSLVTAISTHRNSLLELAARIVGQDTVKAAGAIRKIISSIEDHGIVDVFSRHDPRQIVASIYALSRLQAACQRYDRLHDSKIKNGSKEFTDRDLLQDICDAAPFATAAYGWKLDLATAGKIHRGDLRALTKMTGVKLDDVVTVNWDARPTRPAFYIARDRKRKRIVLSIRGTWSAHDVLTDLWCTPEDYTVSTKTYRAHNGMLEAARGLASYAEEIITKELEDNPDYTLLLVGHSLGGSVAAILGTLWAEKFTNITVFGFGAACVSPIDDTSREQDETNNGLTIFTVLLDGDPFSCLSLGHVADVSFALDYLCQNPDLRSTVLMRTDGPTNQIEDRDLEWCSTTMEEIHKEVANEKLFPPGRLIFMPYKEKGHVQYMMREVSPQFFRYWKIGRRMFDLSRHVPRLYEAKLKFWKTQMEER